MRGGGRSSSAPGRVLEVATRRRARSAVAGSSRSVPTEVWGRRNLVERWLGPRTTPGPEVDFVRWASF
jgi:hypothetical protein